MRYLTPSLFIAAVILSLMIPSNVPAATVGVDATRLKQLTMVAPPLDVETSTDGKLMFVLIRGQVQIYSNMEDQPINRIPVDALFDRIAFAEKLDLLILSSTAGNKVDMLRIDLINDISIEGSPYLGRADAPVTIAVFDDYQ